MEIRLQTPPLLVLGACLELRRVNFTSRHQAQDGALESASSDAYMPPLLRGPLRPIMMQFVFILMFRLSGSCSRESGSCSRDSLEQEPDKRMKTNCSRYIAMCERSVPSEPLCANPAQPGLGPGPRAGRPRCATLQRAFPVCLRRSGSLRL